MNPIYYFANQVYQYSNIMPIYNRVGGTCISKDLKRYLQLKMYLRNLSIGTEGYTFLKTPKSMFAQTENLHKLRGIIISLSNTVLNYDRNNCKSIFVGHGTGDKPYGGNSAEALLAYDYHFISGEKHLEKLRDSNIQIAEEKLIKIGNLRFDAYLNGDFDREKEAKRLGIVDRNRKNILYAPTWRWGNGTFKKYIHRFCQELTPHYNLIVRPHHHDRRYIPHIKLWARRNGIRHVYFSNPAALSKSDTMADFIISDLMISDTSSILYEYLVANKPIIVAVNDYKNLHNMPPEMDVMQHVPLFTGEENLVDLIEKTFENEDLKVRLKNLLHTCFYFNDGKSVDRAIEFLNKI